MAAGISNNMHIACIVVDESILDYHRTIDCQLSFVVSFRECPYYKICTSWLFWCIFLLIL